MGKTICFYVTDEVESILNQIEENLSKKVQEKLKTKPQNTRSKIIQAAILDYATGMIDPKKTAILALLKAIDTLRDYMEVEIEYPTDNYIRMEGIDPGVFTTDYDKESDSIKEYFKVRRELNKEDKP